MISRVFPWKFLRILKTSVSGLWARSSFKIGQNVASTSTIQQFIIFLDLFFGAFLTSCPIVGRAARWQRPARPQNVQAVHLSVQFFFRLLPRSSWSGLQIWSGWLVLKSVNLQYAGLLGRWDKRIVDQASVVPSIIYFHDLLQNSLQISFQLIFLFLMKLQKWK